MDSFVDIPQPSRFRIGGLFSDNNFVVPVYQQNYAWGQNEVEDFWEDLKDLIDGERSSHFFGQIVTYKNDREEQEIIDGQQRLTTSTIFLAVIRDIAMAMYKEHFRGSVDEVNLDSGDDLRLISRQVDKIIRGEKGAQASLMVQQGEDASLQEYFFSLTHGSVAAREDRVTSDPMKNMQTAYHDMARKIQETLKQETNIGAQIEKLQSIYELFVNNFYLVMISAPSLQDAFTIFETLNSRGKDLKASDIIKNHLMSLMGNDRIHEANELWRNITAKLDTSSKRITRFIRTYWAAQYRIVSEAKLYRAVSDKVKDGNQAQAFLKNLDHSVDLYTVLESPVAPKAHAEFFDNAGITQRLDILSRMNVKLYYPIVMAMNHCDYSEKDILKVVNKIMSVFIRHRTIINDGTNKLETGFSEIAKNIWSLEYAGVDAIIDGMNQRLLKSDEATETAFSVLNKDGGLRGAKKWTLVYLLSELYAVHFDDFVDGMYNKVFDDDNYQLVQISTAEEVGEYQTYIGNWTILEKNLVPSKSADSLQMASQLNKSDLKGNQALAKQLQTEAWTIDAIKQRQNIFVNDVTLIW
ncbi:DUF262 domain-containing protein [Levilactobacillus yiduensis]|uniref:DUF262 domain-containing protein n=1 Tax=Levilactobacillus yiduensis TaxID=2953880 RepID=UPI0021579610|nr:DUF262 domain-containing protein [Levilactobacillus yiduensis]